MLRQKRGRVRKWRTQGAQQLIHSGQTVISEKNKKEVLIPEGFGHGYLVLEDSIVSYKCGEKFYAEYDDGIMWKDADININWPLDKIESVILSEKDKMLPSYKEFVAEYNGL